MKILFWILAIASIPFGLFMSIVCSFSKGLGLTGTVVGDVVCIVGTISVAVSIVCAVLGIRNLRKGYVKKAVAFALTGVAFSGIILGGMFLDDALDTVLLEKDIENRNEQLYGENWDAASVIEGIPELYQEELNKYYVAVGEQWPAEDLMDLVAMSMPAYYGDAALDNIGFTMMDVNGDGIQELIIGTAVPAEEGGTAIFCMYSNPENPFMNLTSAEGEVYYLHSGEVDGTYVAEIGGADAVWLLEAEEGEAIVNINYQEGALDPAGRLTLNMIPFSQYK